MACCAPSLFLTAAESNICHLRKRLALEGPCVFRLSGFGLDAFLSNTKRNIFRCIMQAGEIATAHCFIFYGSLQQPFL